ncbi:MAG: bifunctional glutamate N-acetyltransferase/amino-acid acetyltransferase ArgJ [Actinomycetota bacterium]
MAVRWPPGAASAGVASGIKPHGFDLGVLRFDSPCVSAGTFTRNAAAAACVHWSRSLVGRPVRALVVNSGNANACTGRAGNRAVEATAQGAADLLDCTPQEILVASTGPIGIPLPIKTLLGALPGAFATASGSVGSFSEAILTTDSRPKVAFSDVGDTSVVGVAKGAAMVSPNMATMLAFVVTDAAIDPSEFQSCLRDVVEQTFNRISIDACESTNDSVFAFATGASGPVATPDLAKALRGVCWDLAEQIAQDAEGGTRLVRIRIGGAADDAAAATLGRAVAASALWRSAMHGSDPNWGRVVAALGTAGRSLDLDDIEIRLGDETVFARGEPIGSLAVAARQLAGSDVTVGCRVGNGDGSAELLSSDLSPDYVNLNSKGTT